MKTIQLKINDNYLLKKIDTINIKDYKLWNDKELEYLSKVDLSKPLDDNEDYSKW